MIYRGPFDREAWPEKLVANVVEPAEVPRVHGYAIDAIAPRGIAELAWLALFGELPTAEQREAFEFAAVLLAPLHVGDAPTHAAMISRIGAAPPTTTLAIGAIGLGELVRHELAQLGPWLAELRAAEAKRALPDPFTLPAVDARDDVARDRAPTDETRALQHAAAKYRALPDVPLARVAIAYAILDGVVPRIPLALETIAIWARLPLLAAEVARVEVGAIRSYPARLPDYHYVDSEGAAP